MKWIFGAPYKLSEGPPRLTWRDWLIVGALVAAGLGVILWLLK